MSLNKMLKSNPLIIGLSSNIIGNAIMFGTTIYLTRSYPIEVYGEFRLIFTFLALAVVFFQLGRDSGIIYYAQDKTDIRSLNELIKSEILYSALGLIVGAILLYALTPHILNWFLNDSIHPKYFQVSLIMIPLWGIFNVLIAAMKAKSYISESFILANLIQRFLRLPFLIGFSLVSISYYSLAFGMIVSQIILIIYALKSIKINYQLSDLFLYKDFFKRFSYSLQLGLNAIIFVLLSKIDVIMIGKLSDISSVAIYDTVILLSFVVTLPFIALVKANEVFMKALIREEKTQLRYKNDLKLACHLSMVIALFILLAPQDILYIFGEEYISGYTAMIIMTIGYLILCMLGTPIEVLNMNGLGITSSIILILTALINIILNTILIPMYNLEGAAFATILALLFSKLSALFVSKRYFPLLHITNLKPSINLIIFIVLIVIGYYIKSENHIINLLIVSGITTLYLIYIYFNNISEFNDKK